MRIGELMALTKADVDVHKNTISVTKSYQRFDKRDVITEPKTPKSRRVISIPEFLVADYVDYFEKLYDLGDDERIFKFTKHYLTY